MPRNLSDINRYMLELFGDLAEATDGDRELMGYHLRRAANDAVGANGKLAWEDIKSAVHEAHLYNGVAWEQEQQDAAMPDPTAISEAETATESAEGNAPSAAPAGDSKSPSSCCVCDCTRQL